MGGEDGVRAILHLSSTSTIVGWDEMTSKLRILYAMDRQEEAEDDHDGKESL